MARQQRTYRKIDEDVFKRAVELLDKGHSCAAAARIMRSNTGTLYRMVAKMFPKGRGGFVKTPMRSFSPVSEDTQEDVRREWRQHLDFKTTLRALADRHNLSLRQVRQILNKEE